MNFTRPHDSFPVLVAAARSAPLALLALLTLAGPAHAASEVAPLEELAVLYATEPGSGQADAAWAAWVRAHPQADLDRVVRELVSRTMTLRSLAGAGVAPVRPARRPSRAALTEHLLGVAQAARRGTPVRLSAQAGTGAPGDGATARASTSR